MQAPARPQSHEWYGVLGVQKGATNLEINRAYRLIWLKIHPDKNGGRADCAEMFPILKEARAILVNPHRRLTYDMNFYDQRKAEWDAYEAATALSTNAIPNTSRSTDQDTNVTNEPQLRARQPPNASSRARKKQSVKKKSREVLGEIFPNNDIPQKNH